MVSQNGFTTLMRAAARGQRHIVELLLDKDADMEAKDWVSSATRIPLQGRSVDCNDDQRSGMAGWRPAGCEREVVPMSCREGGHDG